METLETERLRIRPFLKSDTARIYKLSREASLGEWIPDQVYEDETEAEGVIEYLISQYSAPLSPNTKPLVMAVELKEGDVIGHVGLNPYGDDEVEIGYAIAEAEMNKGYATEAVSKLSKWALDTIDINQIHGIVADENKSSAKVLEKSGYKLVESSVQNYLGKLRSCSKFIMKTR